MIKLKRSLFWVEKMDNWEELAKEYRKEITQLWKDIDNAVAELETRTPKSFDKCLRLLDKCLNISQEIVKMIDFMEPFGYNDIKEIPKFDKKLKKEKRINDKESKNEGDFKWLRG